MAVEAFEYAWKAARETRLHDLELIPNSVDKLKQFVSNFVLRRSSVPGGCPLLNTAIDADDGNPVLRASALKALGVWRDHLRSIIDVGIKRREIKRSIDPTRLATLIISSLEGALMISRLERDPEALRAAQAHLERYFETEVRLSREATKSERRAGSTAKARSEGAALPAKSRIARKSPV